LKENSRRFCLFPIKYHEVSICKWLIIGGGLEENGEGWIVLEKKMTGCINHHLHVDLGILQEGRGFILDSGRSRSFKGFKWLGRKVKRGRKIFHL
jgi:hypothetical protein